MKKLLFFLLLTGLFGCGSGDIKVDILERQRHITTENEQAMIEAIHRLSSGAAANNSQTIAAAIQQGFQINRQARDQVMQYIVKVESGTSMNPEEDIKKSLDKLEEDSRKWRESLQMAMHAQPKTPQ